nr:MAG TPA: hypothetical protein [Inoviridae sp.]
MLTRRKNRSMMRLRGKEKSNEINIDVDMKRTCHTYQTLIHHDFKKGEM